jgi:hypothetical protein
MGAMYFGVVGNGVAGFQVVVFEELIVEQFVRFHVVWCEN